MRFVYLTTKSYPADTADKIYTKELSAAFSKMLGDDYLFVVAEDNESEFMAQNTENLKIGDKKFKSLRTIPWLLRYIKKHRNVIFFTNDSYLLTVLILFRYFYPIVVVSDWHQLFEDWRDIFIAKQSDILISTSQVLSLELRKITQKPIHTIYGGVDLEKYANITHNKAKSLIGWGNNLTYVTYVGFFKTMGLEKGLKVMIDSLSTLPDHYRMAFVGGKVDEIEEYSEYALQKGVLNRCIFIKRVPHENIGVYQKAADILVIPYPNEPHFARWGFPMKLYEYLASGQPIVYSNLPILSEVLRNKATEFISDDALDLSNKLQMVQGEKKQVNLEIYSWKSKAEKIYQLINHEKKRI